MRVPWIGSLIFISSVAFATEASTTAKKAKGPVVDLGSLEVEGESRQPNLQIIESQGIKDKAFEEVFAEEIRRIENDLLIPRTKIQKGSKP